MSAAFQEHYTCEQVAKLWGLAPNTVRHLFKAEPGVLRFGNEHSRPGQKRCYVTVRIPAHVVQRVHTRISMN